MSARTEYTKVKNTLHREAIPHMEEAEGFMDQAQTKIKAWEKKGEELLDLNARYAKQHSWRIALTAAALGAVAGLWLYRSRK